MLVSESSAPTVLILYSPDCAAHEQVVIELANFMRGEWQLEVFLDLWAQKSILDRGWGQWLNEKLVESQYVLIVCSTGARYKFARNRPFRMKYERAIPDMFVSAVDAVLERCHAATLAAGINSPQCLVAYFDEYAGESEIPPKLDKSKRFVLMKELDELYCHLTRTSHNKINSNSACISPEKYQVTKCGKQLHSVLEKAVKFFADNPDWLGELLEPVNSPESSPAKKQDDKQSSDTSITNETQDQVQNSSDINSPKSQRNYNSLPPNGFGPYSKLPHHRKTPSYDSTSRDVDVVSPKRNGVESASHSRMSSSANEEDALLEERVRKRRLEEEAKMQRVANSHHRPDSAHPAAAETRYSPSKQKSSSMPRNFVVPPPPSSSSAAAGVKLMQSPSINEDIDEEQMKKDLDYIHNFDLHHNWNRPADPNEVLINMDFTSCTPPEDVPLSQTYKNFSIYNGSSLQNGNSNFHNPLFFAMDCSKNPLAPNVNAFNSLPRMANDKNDNVILDFQLPGTNRDQQTLKLSHCDSSTNL